MVPVTPTPLPKNRLERISVNSFGIGGANAHVSLDLLPIIKQLLIPGTTRGITLLTNGLGRLSWSHTPKALQLATSSPAAVCLCWCCCCFLFFWLFFSLCCFVFFLCFLVC